MPPIACLSSRRPRRPSGRAYHRLLILITSILQFCASPVPGGDLPTNSETLCARALISPGDPGLFASVWSKARAGQNITVGVIGGSITQGASATRPEYRYPNLLADWCRKTFPPSQVRLVNAGIGATGSDYGALRASRDLLSHKPDLVVVEYAVNDSNSRHSAETLEGLVRQILNQPTRPAVVLLFMMSQSGASAQESFIPLGKHYKLPMVSYRDALWPEIQANRLRWVDISPDVVHPNDRGHRLAAEFIQHCLQKSLAFPTPHNSQFALPPALYTDLYEHTLLLEADALKPLTNQGWSFDPGAHCWLAKIPGSKISFELPGTAVQSMHWVVRGPMGRASVTIDDRAPVELEGWFDQTWGGYRLTTELARDLAPGRHKVTFELLASKQEASAGHEFRILGLGSAASGKVGPVRR